MRNRRAVVKSTARIRFHLLYSSIFSQSSKDFLEIRIMLPMRIVLNNPELASCKNRHPRPICTRFEHHFHVLKPHLHRRSFSDTLPENQRHLIALKRHPLWHMQKLCQLSQPAELRSTFFRNRNAVLCQDVLQLSNPLALSLEFFLSCVKVFHRLTLHLVVAGPFQF